MHRGSQRRGANPSNDGLRTDLKWVRIPECEHRSPRSSRSVHSRYTRCSVSSEHTKQIFRLVSSNREFIPDELLQYAEDFGISFEAAGIPRMMGRVLGWLLIADPPHQTFSDIVNALGASKGSISNATRSLIEIKLIERTSIPGQRLDVYRVRRGGWSEIIQRRVQYLTEMRILAGRGLELLADAPPERSRHLEEMHSMYSVFEREVPVLIERWRAEQNAKRDDAAE